jgi:hypothetical protein
MADTPAENLPSKTSLFRKFRHPQKRAFLRALSVCGKIGEAAEKAGMHRDMHYYWLKTDEKYVEAFEEARQMAGDLAEDEVWRRGFDGFDHPVIYEGKITTTYKAYSDNLAMFSLKGLRPEKYRDNQAGVSFQGPTQINITIKGEASRLPAIAQDLLTCSDKKDE